jgi:hypothetical protein
MPSKLPKRIIDILSSRIEQLFEGVKTRLTGRGKRLVITHDPNLSIPKIYEQAIREEGGLPNLETLSKLTQTANNYVDALKFKTINQAVKNLEQHLHETKKVSPQSINNSLKETFDSIAPQVERIVNTETQAAKSFGLLEGIVRMNASIGIEDPVVFWVSVNDEHRCDTCTRLHTIDGTIPRLWYLSEVARGYIKKNSEVPSLLSPHPNCRCHMTTMAPSFGFDSKGLVTYIKSGHSEIEKQRAS